MAWNGVLALLIEKFSGDGTPVSVSSDGDRLIVRVDGSRQQLTRAQAVALRDRLDDALTDRREFTHTACTCREDGSYVVERRGADSAGHRKVFESLRECRRLFERLPDTFTAADVCHTGVTAGRKHMLVWHFVEHDAFDCELVSRQPLTARKRSSTTAASD